MIVVAPDGAHNGAGTPDSPMSLARAIGMVDAQGRLLVRNPGSIVPPGSRVRLKAGTYRYRLGFEPRNGNVILGIWHFSNQGTAEEPIWFEPYGDGPVVLDGNLSANPSVPLRHRNFPVVRLDQTSRHVRLFNVRITNSDSSIRVLRTPFRACPPWSADESNRCDRPGGGYDDYGVGNRAIHVHVVNAGEGFGLWNRSSGAEWSIARLNGWDAPDRLHGHGMYVQSDGTQGQKLINDNISFGNLANELNARGSGSASIRNIHFLRNAFFSGEVMVGGPPISDITFTALYAYQSLRNFALEVGESTRGNTRITVEDSYIYNRDNGGIVNADGVHFNKLEDAVYRRNVSIANRHVTIRRSESNPPLSNFQFEGNEYYRGDFRTGRMNALGESGLTFVEWQGASSTFDNAGSAFRNLAAFQPAVLGRSSPWIPGYSMVVVYNPSGEGAVTLQAPFLKSLGLAEGGSFTITNVQDYDNDVTTVAAWDGGAYSLDMQAASRGRALPLGMTMQNMIHRGQYRDYQDSFPYFGVFIVQASSR